MVASGTFEYFKAVPPFTMLRRLLNSIPFVKSPDRFPKKYWKGKNLRLEELHKKFYEILVRYVKLG